MYLIKVIASSGYVIATFEAGKTLEEANAAFREFVHSGLYMNYKIVIDHDA